MSKKVWWGLGAAGALMSLSIANPALAAGDSLVDVEEMLPVLGQPPTANDRLPEGIDPGELGDIRQSTVRSLGSDGTAEYWVARAGSSNLCLILNIPGGAEVSASACGPITSFYRTGIALGAGESPDRPERSVVAYLLPSDVEMAKLTPLLPSIESSTYNARSNMLSMPWHGETMLPEVELPRSNGEIFNFVPLENGES